MIRPRRTCARGGRIQSNSVRPGSGLRLSRRAGSAAIDSTPRRWCRPSRGRGPPSRSPRKRSRSIPTTFARGRSGTAATQISRRNAPLRTIYESLEWHEVRITAHAAAQYIPLKYGEAGSRGPRATLIAGTHGDEGPWSAVAIKMLCRHASARLTGRLRIIFTANALAAEVERRNSWIDSPNPLDLDGVFPGDTNGSHTNRLAAALAPLITDSDVVIDLHGGGTWCVNTFVKQFEGSEQLAADIGAPFITKAPNKPGGLTTYARSLGIKVVNIEVGAGAAKRCTSPSALQRGSSAHSIASASLPSMRLLRRPSRQFTSAQRRPCTRVGGVFVPTMRDDEVGTIVPIGTEMGKILDLHTLAELQVFTAPYEQTAMLLLRPQICTVEGSALVYVIGKPA